jgi:hypothetical protein
MGDVRSDEKHERVSKAISAIVIVLAVGVQCPRDDELGFLRTASLI